MAVKKFRDISEMVAPRHEPGSRQLYEVIRHVWGLSDRICPQRFPAGVFKHRSIEEAEALRKQWEEENRRNNCDANEYPAPKEHMIPYEPAGKSSLCSENAISDPADAVLPYSSTMTHRRPLEVPDGR